MYTQIFKFPYIFEKVFCYLILKAAWHVTMDHGHGYIWPLKSWRSMYSLSNFAIFISYLIPSVFPIAFQKLCTTKYYKCLQLIEKQKSFVSCFCFCYRLFLRSQLSKSLNVGWRYYMYLFDKIFTDNLIYFGLLSCLNHSFHHLKIV